MESSLNHAPTRGREQATPKLVDVSPLTVDQTFVDGGSEAEFGSVFESEAFLEDFVDSASRDDTSEGLTSKTPPLASEVPRPEGPNVQGPILDENADALIAPPLQLSTESQRSVLDEEEVTAEPPEPAAVEKANGVPIHSLSPPNMNTTKAANFLADQPQSDAILSRETHEAPKLPVLQTAAPLLTEEQSPQLPLQTPDLPAAPADKSELPKSKERESSPLSLTEPLPVRVGEVVGIERGQPAVLQSVPISPTPEFAKADHFDFLPRSISEPQAARADIPRTSPLVLLEARPIIGQVATAIVKADGGKLDIRLDPPELGRLSVRITGTDDTVNAVVAADRAETQDLLRRHADMLQRALRDAGYSDVTLDFSAYSEGGQDTGSDAPPKFDQTGTEQTAGKEIHAFRFANSGLDIRL